MIAPTTLAAGSLFTGYGGLDLAVAKVLGAETVWHCDNDPAASRLLAYRYPGVPNLGDVTAVDWTTVQPVDVIAGGSPCQDVSAAGQRQGMRADTRSGLWASMCDAIEVLCPRLVVWENVRGALSAAADSALEPCPGCLGDRDDGAVLRALGRVLGDLAGLGFDAEWISVPAAGVGCPHLRWRVFVLAVAENPDSATGRQRRQPAPGQAQGRRARADAGGRGGAPAADTVREPVRQQSGRRGGQDGSGAVRPGQRGVSAANAQGDGRYEGWPESARQLGGSDAADRRASAADSDGGRAQMLHDGAQRPRARGARAPGLTLGNAGDSPAGWGPYAAAIARWESVTERPAPVPTLIGKRGSPQLNPALPEWMMGLPDGWICAVPGLSRADQLKLAGNGVVPQQAAAALRILLARRPSTRELAA